MEEPDFQRLPLKLADAFLQSNGLILADNGVYGSLDPRLESPLHTRPLARFQLVRDGDTASPTWLAVLPPTDPARGVTETARIFQKQGSAGCIRYRLTANLEAGRGCVACDPDPAVPARRVAALHIRLPPVSQCTVTFAAAILRSAISLVRSMALRADCGTNCAYTSSVV